MIGSPGPARIVHHGGTESREKNWKEMKLTQFFTYQKKHKLRAPHSSIPRISL